jgi:excisionase family DNA binding protein
MAHKRTQAGIKYERGLRKHLFTVEEACFALGGIGPTKLYALIRAGDLVAIKIGDRTMVPESALIRFLGALPVADLGTSPRARRTT